MTAKRKAPTTAFQPGTSGNPKGKPAGTRSKATQLLLALMEGDASAITKAVIDAAKGGDLGWASPGMFVPEFEEAMNRLEPSQVSDPVVSRFGVHLIQLMERRKVALSPCEQRDTVRAMLRDKKLDPAFSTWAEGLRARAYIEFREPPSKL